MLGILNSRGMGGPTVLPWQYDRISDWDLLHIYLAPRDEDGTWVTLRQRYRQAAGWHQEELAEEDELPKDPFAALNVPREACLFGVPVQYVAMFYAVWRRRGLPDDQILVKLREKVADVPPIGSFSQTGAAPPVEAFT